MIRKIKEKRNLITSLIFIMFGLYFWLYSEEMHYSHNDLLGIGEMTWMWFLMGIFHLFIKNCECKR